MQPIPSVYRKDRCAISGVCAGNSVTLRPDLTLLPLDGDAVVFSEETQRLIGLNRTAALLVEKLQRGIPACELARAFATEGLAAPDEAAQWVAVTLDALRSCGILDADPVGPTPPDAAAEDDAAAALQAAECAPYRAFEPAAERRYRLLETSTLIRFGHLAQVRLVDSVLGHLATEDDAAPDIVVDISAKTADASGAV